MVGIPVGTVVGAKDGVPGVGVGAPVGELVGAVVGA